MFACAALAEHAFTGGTTSHFITPTTTRRTAEEFQTTGWFTGTVPITVPVGAESFAESARAAQASFDDGLYLAHVPFDRVLELAAAEGGTSGLGLRSPDPGVPMVSFLDAGLPPLSANVVAEWERMNGKVYSDARLARQIGLWVNRGERETTVTVGFPDNPIARESVERYVSAMAAVYLGVADGAVPVSARGHVWHGEALHRNTVREPAPLVPLAKG